VQGSRLVRWAPSAGLLDRGIGVSDPQSHELESFARPRARLPPRPISLRVPSKEPMTEVGSTDSPLDAVPGCGMLSISAITCSR